MEKNSVVVDDQFGHLAGALRSGDLLGVLFVGDRTDEQVRRDDQGDVRQVHFVEFAVRGDLLEQSQDLGQRTATGAVEQQNEQIEYLNLVCVVRNARNDQEDLLQIIGHQRFGKFANELLEDRDHIEHVELIEQLEEKRMQHLALVVDVVGGAAEVELSQFFFQRLYATVGRGHPKDSFHLQAVQANVVDQLGRERERERANREGKKVNRDALNCSTEMRSFTAVA